MLKEALDEAVTSEQSGRSVEEIQMQKSNSLKTARWVTTVHHEETENIRGDEDADNSEEDKIHVTVDFERAPCRMEVNTGSATTIISQTTLDNIIDKKKQQNIKPSHMRL
ncbi:hypothetical protein E2320_017426 [Naja naja]|nr:hypothetical protein E2320_017426 [Naja naja]